MNAAVVLIATFTVSDGVFVEAKVTKDGRPLTGALIRVYDGGSGPPLADGETVDGVGVFPLTGNAGLVGITVEGKECDLIPLKIDGGAASPPRVLLTFGTRPCCVAAKKDESPPVRPVPYALYAVLAASVLLAAATVVLMTRVPRASGPREGAEVG